MNAKSVVNVLLELNIVNLPDLDREIRRLSASLYDPRAAGWLKRVARHWIMNMDWLQRPYEAPAQPWSKRLGGRPSEYYAEPSSRSDLLWPAWRGKQPPSKPNVCQRCKGEKVIFDPKTNQHLRCPSCGGTGLGEKPYAGGWPCQMCRGTGSLKPGPGHGELIPAQKNDEGSIPCHKCKGTGIFQPCAACGGTGRVEDKKCRKCKGTGKAPYEYTQPAGHQGYFTGESLMRFLLDEADLPGYDPAKRTYTTNLHVQPEMIECPTCMRTNPETGETTGPDPDCPRCGGTGKTRQRIAKDITQNFQPFNPQKAKAKGLLGDPPTRSELQPWMTGPAAAGKEFHHFDPIQVTRRDLFTRLNDLVSYLNYMARALKRPIELSAEEAEDMDPADIETLTKNRQADVQEATALFKRLEVMKPDDVNGFREIMGASEDFIQKIKDHPELFTSRRSGRIIARANNLVLRRCTDADTALVCGRKKTWNGREETWCLHSPGNVEYYLTQSPLYFIEKDGKSYVGIHPGSQQCRNTENYALGSLRNGAGICQEVAPVVAQVDEIDSNSLRSNAPILADLVDKLRMERRRGIRA